MKIILSKNTRFNTKSANYDIKHRLSQTDSSEWIRVHQDPSKSKTWKNKLEYLMDTLDGEVRSLGYSSVEDLAVDRNNKLPTNIQNIVSKLIEEYENQIVSLRNMMG